MIATLRLEAIGDNYARLRKQPLKAQLRAGLRGPREHLDAILAPSWRAWVAEVRAMSRSGKIDRSFLRGLKDYSAANGTGSRGVFVTYILRPDTLYEVNALETWSRQRRYFCRAVEGRVVELSTAEAAEWLDARAAQTPHPARPVDLSAIQRVVNQAGAR